MSLLQKFYAWRNGYSKLQTPKTSSTKLGCKAFEQDYTLDDDVDSCFKESTATNWVVDNSIIPDDAGKESDYAYVFFVDFDGGRIAMVHNEPPEVEHLRESALIGSD